MKGDAKPQVQDIFRFVDDRGVLDQVLKEIPKIKRVYSTISKFGVIRGMHGHFLEKKIFYVTKGSAKFVMASMDEDPLKYGEITTFTLDEMKPQILILPPKYYHGYTSLGKELRMMIFSDATLEESKSDDHRLSPREFERYFEVQSK